MCCSINMNDNSMFNVYYCEYGKAGNSLLIMMHLHKDKTFTVWGTKKTPNQNQRLKKKVGKRDRVMAHATLLR